jgi:hypothetical protein
MRSRKIGNSMLPIRLKDGGELQYAVVDILCR